MDNMEREDLTKDAYEDFKELPKVEDSNLAKPEASKVSVDQESVSSESVESEVKGHDEIEPITVVRDEAKAIISEEKPIESENKEHIEKDKKADTDEKPDEDIKVIHEKFPQESPRIEDSGKKSHEDIKEIHEEFPKESPRIEDTEVEFNIKYDTNFGEKVVVIGSSQDLGEWNLESAFELQWTEGGVWAGKKKLKTFPIEYKYACISKETSRWEDGLNRILNSDHLLLNDTWQTSN